MSVESRVYVPRQEILLRVVDMEMALKAKRRMQIKDMSTREYVGCIKKANNNCFDKCTSISFC